MTPGGRTAGPMAMRNSSPLHLKTMRIRIQADGGMHCQSMSSATAMSNSTTPERVSRHGRRSRAATPSRIRARQWGGPCRWSPRSRQRQRRSYISLRKSAGSNWSNRIQRPAHPTLAPSGVVRSLDKSPRGHGSSRVLRLTRESHLKRSIDRKIHEVHSIRQKVALSGAFRTLPSSEYRPAKAHAASSLHPSTSRRANCKGILPMN